MKRKYISPLILWIDFQEEYNYCESDLVSSKGTDGTKTQETGGYSLVKTITMDHSDDEW